jgi:GABA permease
VAAIILFLGLGTMDVPGVWPGRTMDFSNLVSNGWFFPNGVGAIFSSVVVVIFSMVDAEIGTIAAAESKDPARAIRKATNSVILRVALFFGGSLFLLAVILPWDSTELGASPFVSAFDRMGMPFAGDVMNAVVLTAVLSFLNSGLYTASRMLFVLAARQEAPARLVQVTSRGVPRAAILLSSVVGFLCVIAAAVSPDTVFLFLLNSSGAIILFVYPLISISQIVLRPCFGSADLPVKMWLFPGLSILTVVGILSVLAQMALGDEIRPQLVLNLVAWAVVLVLYVVSRARDGSIDPDATFEKPEVEASLPTVGSALPDAL